MAEPTPGPWVAYLSDNFAGAKWTVESAKEHGIANGGCSIATFHGPDAEANARLCAAVPALLAALGRR